MFVQRATVRSFVLVAVVLSPCTAEASSFLLRKPRASPPREPGSPTVAPAKAFDKSTALEGLPERAARRLYSGDSERSFKMLQHDGGKTMTRISQSNKYKVEELRHKVMEMKRKFGASVNRTSATTLCNTYKRLKCAEGNTWTYSRHRPAGSLSNCQASCNNRGKGFFNYFPKGACLCCASGDHGANGWASLSGPTNCQDPASAPFTTTRTKADVDAFITSWASSAKVARYSVLAGDKDGVRYILKNPAGTASAPGLYEAEKVDKAIYSFSAGKWPAAAAIGRAILARGLRWDDQITKFIPWWTTSASDPRSRITFRHLLSHTSGLIADSTFAHYAGIQDIVRHADCKWMNSTIKLEEQAQLIYHRTGTDISPGVGIQRYGETHYLIAQFAIMKATGYTEWRKFFYDFWGKHLGLEMVQIMRYGTFTLAQSFFPPQYEQSLSYGFYEPNATGAGMPNPDAGAQLIISPCAYTRFLTEYVREPWQYVGAPALDDTVASSGSWETHFGNYGLGHWIYDDGVYNIWHSLGYAGFTPLVSTMPQGEKFWVLMNMFDSVQGSWTAMTFIRGAADIFRELFQGANKPAVTTSHCSTKEPTAPAVYGKEWNPKLYTSADVTDVAGR